MDKLNKDLLKKNIALRLNIQQYMAIQVGKVIFFFILVFAVAGSFNYWQGWLFIGYKLIIAIFSLLIFKNRLGLIAERLHPGTGTEWWDKLFWLVNFLLNFIIIVLAVLDGGKYHFTKSIPLEFYTVSVVLFFASNAVLLWAMYINNFFSSVVRIQNERGQFVIDGGPYRFIRHPGYIAAIIVELNIPLLLGSTLALIPACILIIVYIIRTYLEDRKLAGELAGYAEYAKRTKYMLIPGIC